MHWPIPLNGHHPVSPCVHCPRERGGPARALRFNEKAVMPCRSGVLRDARGWIRERWMIAFAIPFEPNKRAGRVTGSTRRGGNLLNARAFSRFFFMGKRRLRGFARRMAGNAVRGPRCMGPAWHSGPRWRLFCRFSRLAAPFRAFSAAPEHLERPHGRVFCQPGRKTL